VKFNTIFHIIQNAPVPSNRNRHFSAMQDVIQIRAAKINFMPSCSYHSRRDQKNSNMKITNKSLLNCRIQAPEKYSNKTTLTKRIRTNSLTDCVELSP
jgi:hypothetical protein